MFDLTQPVILRPVAGSRRPEAMAWLFALVMLVAALFVNPELRPVWFGTRALAAYFGFSAVVMSIGNWLERNTQLTLDVQGLELAMPGRTTRLPWATISRLEVRHSAYGSRVFVSGEEDRISFRTLADVKIRDKIRDRYGFENSDAILALIQEKAALNNTKIEITNGYLYTRD